MTAATALAPVPADGATASDAAAHPEVSLRDLMAFLMDAAAILLASGCSSNRAEDLVTYVAQRFDCTCEPLAVPTGFWMTLARPGSKEPSLTEVRRVRNSGTNLNLLIQVDDLVTRVVEGRLGLAEADAELRRLSSAPPLYGAWLGILALAITSASVAQALRGSWPEIAITFVAGLGVGFIQKESGKWQRSQYLGDLLSAAMVALFARLMQLGLANLGRIHVSEERLVIGGIIALLPGLVLTNALSELSHKNLVSGTAKLVEALAILLSLVFGIAAVWGLWAVGEHVWSSRLVVDAVTSTDVRTVANRALTAGLPTFAGHVVDVLVIVVAAGTFGVLLRTPPRYLLLTCALGLLSSAGLKMGSGIGLGVAYATFLASCVVGVASNALARRLGRPSQVFLTPGVILLVPGSVGYRALQSLLAGHQQAGIELALTAGLTAGGIVSGLLLANLLLPSRKIL
jgi:uncharacterized membrane protein YjjP (DUF1212 family)